MPGNEIIQQRAHNLIRLLNSHRLLFYALSSSVAVFAVITNALKNYSNFYSVAIFLSKSSRSVLALANFGFLTALLCGHLVQRIFFGTLRANEVERLYDRLWFFITESLLAFTIFRDEFDTPFALMFGFLLFVKSFHWLASDRIEWMDQRPYPGPPLLFHLRMTILFIILWTTDCVMFLFAVEHTIAAGVGGMVLFASEYGILMASVMNTILKYFLSAYDLRRAGQRGGENAPPWENKSMWVFYIELATDFLKLATYLVFFTIIITFYGLPLNIVRDVYITARSFISRLRALHRYQTATRNMDQRYPNATEQELTAMTDRTCIICREEMIFQEAQSPPVNTDGPNTTPKKLPCGHIFHFYCLRSWLERQQSCPTCRRTVLDNDSPTVPRPGNIPLQAPPAGAPQQPNAGFAAPNPNQQGGNPLGNPLGFVNRLFGPPAQAPNNPALGQPPFPNMPRQNQTMANPGNVAGQNPQGIVIQYQIQYQMPRPQSAQPQPRNLHPVPQYVGFPGPNGVWQPWPLNDDDHGLHLQPTVAGGNPQPSPMASTSSSQQMNTLNRAPQISLDGGPSNSPEESAQSPRNAAALAALGRVNGNKQPLPAGQNRSPSPSSGALPLKEAPRQNNDSTTDASRERPDIMPPHPQLPQLIPLFDYNDASTRGSTMRGPQLNQAYGPRSVGQNPYHNGVEVPSAGHMFDSANSAFSSTQNIRRHPESTQPHLQQLPPSLTDEQLSIMDRLTREAIDERLRVLEGVSNSIYRCVDDLMRMRSTLPTSYPLPNDAVFADLNDSEETVASSSNTSRQKEKQAVVGNSESSGARQDVPINGSLSQEDRTSP